ncbi:MAG: hypothetical protein HZB61_00745 [Nitrospirae bacterium]|nr:hypothetical protein [Nitrospirota bacterium]
MTVYYINQMLIRLLIIFAMLSAVPSYAEDSIVNIIKKYENTFLSQSAGEDSKVMLKDLLSRSCGGHSDFETEAAFRKELISDSEKDTGLHLEGGYNFNSRAEAEINRKQHLYLGVYWDVLRDGYYAGKRRASSHENELRILELRQQEIRRREDLPCYVNAIISEFSSAKLKMLHDKHQFLQDVLPELKRLYYLGYLPFEEISDLKSETVQTENRISQYYYFSRLASPAGISPASSDIAHKSFPVFDVDLDGLLRETDANDTTDRTIGFKKEILDNKYSRWNDVRLKLFARANTYEDSSKFDEGASLGFYFSVPLNVFREKAVTSAELERDAAMLRREQSGNIEDIVETWYELKYKIDDVIKMYGKKLHVTEKLRRETVRQDFDPDNFDMLLAVSLMKDLMDIDFEMLDAKEKAYLRTARLYALSKAENFTQYVNEVELNERNFEFRRPGERALYIWSDAFNREDNRFIIEFAVTKTISTIILSFSEKTDLSKLSVFLGEAKKRNISVELMVSSNNWIFPERAAEAETKLKDILNYGPSVSAVHIDIEPHTLEGWKTNRDEYMGLYIGMLERMKEIVAGKIKMSVSIPVFYDAKYLPRIFHAADRVYVMAYEIKDIDKLKNGLQEAMEVDKGKIVLALRPKDFTNELEMEEFIEKVMGTTGLGSFAFHDFGQHINITRQP